MEERVRTADLEDSWQRNPIVRELLLRLGRHALTSLRPKLVIFDEFQRFRNLFTEGDSEAQALMRRFLQAEADGAHVLFLSATPYKMLTLSREDTEAGDHHADFLETIAVLYGAEGRNVVTGLREEMRHFRSHLRAFGVGLDPAAGPAKRAVEDRLRRVMSRTERVSTDTGDAGIRRRVLPVPVEENDLRQARAVHDVASRIGGNDRADYWKSAPYLFSFMNEYDLTRRLRAHPDRASFARLGKGAMVPDDKRRRFEAIPAGNGRMRALMDEVLGQTDLHRRLWLPPALPYLAGGSRLTKTLIFSDWQMVPEAVLGEILPARRLHSVVTASKETGVPRDRLRAMLATNGYVTPRGQGTFAAWELFDADKAKDFLTSAAKAVTLKDILVLLNMSKSQVDTLRAAGFLKPSFEGEGLAPLWDPDEAQAFLSGFLHDAIQVSNGDPEWEQVSAAGLRLRVPPGEILQMRLDGRLARLGQLRGAAGYRSLMVNTNDLIDARTGTDDLLNMETFAKAIGLRWPAARRLVMLGLTPSTELRNPASGAMQRYITPADLRAFHQRYATLLTLSAELGRAWQGVSHLLKVKRVPRVQVDGRDFGQLYARKDLEDVLRAAMLTLPP
ncbi:hypothetical protein PE067_09695 [Paracoccus sp. DMF-8]|uniref:hypothetical protein n=1 Tax=Paracoccus sp. DMF-8 TaxID=3019445 RepID=UPI0023E7583D|nr:hypothetical protein [Paracoccus sp. DMF-8]MDF3606389.1 hypothetical protein [Paracoccus sp. DMF-8]